MSEQAVFDSLKYRIETEASGTRRYYNSAGQLHRLDGPAVAVYGGHAEWFLYGRRLTEEEFNRAITQYE